MKRRQFLQSAAVIPAIALLPHVEAAKPLTLYADGIHDDSDALQAWFDGHAVAFPDGAPVPDAICWHDFRLSKTIVNGRCRKNRSLHGCNFIFGQRLNGAPAFILV